MTLVKTFLAVFVTMMVLDFIWLGQIVSGFYLTQMNGLVKVVDGKMQIQYLPAFLVYLLMTVGVVFFVLPRLQATDPWWLALGTGMIFGLILYGVYDMTNLATIEKWSWGLSLVDMAWGAFALGVATLVGNLVSRS